MKRQYQLIRRHVTINGKESTIALERLFWMVVDETAKGHAQKPRAYIDHVLAHIPADYCGSKTGWVRFFVAGKMVLQLDQIAKGKDPSKSA